MHPEVVLLFVALLTAAPAAIAAGWRAAPAPVMASARDRERLLWASLWKPLLPAAAIGGLLVGWAIAEPVPADEHVTALAALLAVPFAYVWARALARAVWACWHRPSKPPAATVGIVRPTIVISPLLSELLDADAVAAVRQHEVAHARHRDPLRIWLAQVATDLQWPGRGAQDRLRAWRRALEMARDEEAREAGMDGLDLAAGILGVARLASCGPGPSAAFFDDEASFRERIERLSAPVAPDRHPARMLLTRAALLAALTVTVIAGAVFGDPIVAALLRALA